MRWPTSAEIDSLSQTERNFSKLYLGVQRGKTLLGQTLVAADAYDGDEHSLTFSAATDLSEVRPSMTLACGTAADPFLYGSARIREVDDAGDVLYLEPNNLWSEGYWSVGNYVRCDGIFRLYRKLPFIVSGVVYEDGNSDTLLAAAGIPGYGIDFAVNYLDRPVALMGCPRFAWAGEPVNFYGWRSHGRGGNTISNYAWSFDGGVVTGGADVTSAGTPADPVTVIWNSAGEYVVSLTVTDDSGKAGNDEYGVPFTRHRAVRPVLVYDKPGEGDNTPYSDFEIESLTGKYGSGWTARIKVFGTADKSEFPDNALVVLFAEDWYGGTKQSMGGWYGQEGIIFVGYVRAGSVTADFEKSTVTFTADTIEQWMKEIDIWPANFESTAGAPTVWHEFQTMTIEDILWYLAEFRSNLKDVVDCFFSSDPDSPKQVDFLDLTEGSLCDQMSGQIGSCFFGQLSASRQGSVHLFRHKNMLGLAERLLYGIPIFHFQREDWHTDVEIGEERMRDGVAQVDFVGFIYDANGNPLEVYSLAPEHQTNFGRIEKITGILLSGSTIAAAQAESNTLAGLYRAWKNVRFPHIKIPVLNNRFLETATQDYFAVSLSDTVRGLDWAKREFLTTSVTYHFDNEKGVFLVDVEGEVSTWGPEGVAGDYPHDDYGDDPNDSGPGTITPDPPNPDDPPEQWPPGTQGVVESGNLVFFLGAGNNKLYRTQNALASAGDVVYEDLGALPAGVGTVQWVKLDPFSPSTTGVVCGDDGSYISYDLNTAAPTWTLIAAAPGFDNHFQVTWSKLRQGRFMIARHWYYGLAPAGYVDSVLSYDDYGSIGGGVSFQAPAQAKSLANSPRVEFSTHDEDRCWCIYDRDGDTYVAQTTDFWASYVDNDLAPPWSVILSLHHRNMNNDADNFALYGHGDVDGVPNGDAFVTRCLADVATCTTSAAMGNDEGDETYQVGSCDLVLNKYWALTGPRSGAYPATWRFHVSDDGLVWTEQEDFDATVVRHIMDWPSNPNRFYACTDGGPIMLSKDRGLIWSPLTGNWGAVGGGAGAIVCGAVAKPLWI